MYLPSPEQGETRKIQIIVLTLRQSTVLEHEIPDSFGPTVYRFVSFVSVNHLAANQLFMFIKLLALVVVIPTPQ